ncbi:hypothetical protein C8J56DRAFT_946137 [Mycena floridula]|nr:hypothetical protein C8J56DRAFT_946137 [Mycena floridula]
MNFSTINIEHYLLLEIIQPIPYVTLLNIPGLDISFKPISSAQFLDITLDFLPDFLLFFLDPTVGLFELLHGTLFFSNLRCTGLASSGIFLDLGFQLFLIALDPLICLLESLEMILLMSQILYRVLWASCLERRSCSNDGYGDQEREGCKCRRRAHDENVSSIWIRLCLCV